MNRSVIAVSWVLTAALAVAFAQEPAAQRPQTTFTASVELVSVDVTVLDRDGRPLDGLNAADFSLLVDGQPRRIATAEFVRPSAPETRPPVAAHYSSNAHAGNGRLIALIIDQGNISAGRARAAVQSAMRFVKGLSPGDRVGLFVIPGPGPRINFTSQHAFILAQLPKVVGYASGFAPVRLGLGEASRIERGDQNALNTVADRECSPAERLVCMQELGAEARELVGEARDRTRNSLGPLRALLDQFAESSEPKMAVFLSEALVVEREGSELQWIGPLAARGRVSVHALRIDSPGGDASATGRSFSRTEDRATAEEGLAMLAGLTRGSFHRVVGNADAIFKRLAYEMSGYYLLGFEPEAGDRDGRPHKIKIAVAGKRGVEVRAREDFMVEPPRVLTSEEAVAEALRSPMLASDVGLTATSYTFREAGSQKLRILVAVDVDRSRNPSGSMALGYALLDGRGAIVSSHFEQQLKTPVDPDRMTQHYVAAATGDAPGVYGLKVAVVDDRGMRGSVEHAFRAQLTSIGGLRAADLLIGDTSAGVKGAAPTVAAEFLDAETVHGYLELYADSPEALKAVSVTLEIAPREHARALTAVPLRFDAGISEAGRKVGEGVLPIALLPPGEYYARAVITIDGRQAGQVGRPIRVARMATASVDASASSRRRSRTAALPAFRIEPFHHAAVLTPDVVGLFVERLGGAVGPAAVPGEVLEQVRRGAFSAASVTAKSAGHALAAVFLEGLSLYAREQFEQAALKFREAIRIDSEFFPAAFYLGACYAANGRDRDASAAWQTSLVTESDAPFIYALLGDALLRQREMAGALDILNDAVSRWPEDGRVQARLATALAMNGQPADAIRVLDGYLAKQPGDSERLFLALRLLYEAHAARRTIISVQEDRERFKRYASAYEAAGGNQLALVEQWRTFMSR